MIYNHIFELIGNTPILKVDDENNSTVFAKLEMFNPGGSIKDRIAYEMIEDLKKEGLLNKNTKIVEATSGNTGIGLAMVLASYGYSITIVMPENMSKERQDLMKAYGATIVLTKADKGMQGAENKAHEMEKEGYFFINQFENKANLHAHYKTTAEEIIKDFPNGIDYFVAGVGTAGTLIGCGKRLKEKFPNIKIVAVEPAESAVLEGEKSGKHNIQGIGAGFVPPLYDKSLVDEIIKIKTADAEKETNMLAKEGLLLGISSGAAILASKKIAKMHKGAQIICICPDGGIKYLSTGIY